MTTSTPDPGATARAYLDAWKAEDYAAMYASLTSISRDAITEEKFTARYRKVASEAALRGWDYEVLAALTNSPYSAQVNYSVVLHSVLVGDIQADTVMNLSLEEGRWRVQWDDALILPQLKGGNNLKMEYRIPSRNNIYDRNGHALVAQADAVAIGLDTGKVSPQEQSGVLRLLQEATGVRADVIQPQLENYRNSGWYLPVADVSTDQIKPYLNRLSAYAGIVLTPFRSRYYFDEGIAPHVVGYMSAIQKAEVEYYKRLGYGEYERVGRSGLEIWGEPYLAGVRGGALYVVSPEGAVVTKLAETDPQPSQAIYTTLDKDLQEQTQAALGDFKGAIVVLERDTGRVLAMVSSPKFNPNLFEPTNYNYSFLIDKVFGPDSPTLNRATQGQYPLGSVFKIITMSAALKSGLYTSETTYECGYDFTEIPGFTAHDWTWDHYQQDGKTQPSGHLTLPEGLMRSCNPFFWHIGLDLFSRGMTNAIADMARGFGLGSRTGIEIEEEAGNVPVPASVIDSVNDAIGQGTTQVTPLQVADFVAAVGNGGTLYTPHVVERIVPPDGKPTYVFTPTIRGTLPISPTQLKIVQDAMVSVVADRRGTARHRFIGLDIKVAGKTGTAQSGSGEPHAWFTGYTFEGKADKPDIAVVVLVENIGEGSDYAAPIFRRVLEVYYYTKPLSQYWWESQIGVIKTPTPVVTDTPTPEDTPEATQAP